MTSEDLKIKSRIRLARNLEGRKFPHKLDEGEAKLLIDEIKEAFFIEEYLKGEFNVFDLNEITEIENLRLFEKNLISSKLIANRNKASVLINKNEEVSIMINEEDHIRLQTISDSKNLYELYKEASLYDDLLEEKLKFAFREDLGYLTTCPSNLGTALRASIMVHLPVSTKLDRIDFIARKLSAMGMTIRGIYGEGSEALGSIYQISNEVSLGMSEEYIIENMEDSINAIINFEKREQEKLILNDRLKIEDTIYRSYGLLKNARLLDKNESLDLLSNLRFAAVNEMIDMEPKYVDEMIIKTRDANLIYDFGQENNFSSRDVLKLRAAIIRNMLKGEVN